MQSGLSSIEFKMFKRYIEEKCGIDIPEEKSYLIETRLTKLLADSGKQSFEEFYYYIINSSDLHIMERIVDAITTNETYWFRDKSPWEIIGEAFMPIYVQQLRSYKKHKIRIWSAAASTGQEAYSTAMFIDNWLKINGIKDIGLEQFEIIATDISNTVLDIAKKGRYDAISVMRGLDVHYRDIYFKKDGAAWEIDQRIRNSVKFIQFNLQKTFLLLGNFDIIFCRYVLIYFSNVLKEDVVSKFANCIEREGALFLGSSELYPDADKYFNMIQSKKGTYYTRRDM